MNRMEAVNELENVSRFICRALQDLFLIEVQWSVIYRALLNQNENYPGLALQRARAYLRGEMAWQHLINDISVLLN